ncbi:MAG: hypothetical protein H6838_11245 [Planctomycetes bacterium]|nr:hypothetical protein [Planctomycetota bacterium]
MKVRFVDRVVHVAAVTAISLAARVPQWFGYGLAMLLGRLFFVVDRRRRRYAMTFLRQAFPERSDAELRRIGSAATGNLFKVPLDMARLTRLLARGGDLHEVVDHEGGAAGLAAKPPFLAVTPHLGSWEIAAAAMAQAFGGGHGVARVSKNPLLQRWIAANRARCGLVIHPRRGGIRGLSRALEQGAVGLQVVDQNQRLRGVFAPFFGRIASCERAAASLALRHDYPMAVGAVLRVGSGFRFRMVLPAPFRLTRTGDRRRDLYQAVCEINRRVEELIRLAPEQYLWIHDRYRTQPPPGWVEGVVDDGEVDGDSAGDE